MANLQVKGIDDNLYEQLKRQAAAENRSVSQEIIYLVKSHLSAQKTIRTTPTPAEVLLQLAGSWEDSRPAEEIVAEIRGLAKTASALPVVCNVFAGYRWRLPSIPAFACRVFLA